MDRKYIIIGLLIVIFILICAIMLVSVGNSRAYQNFTCDGTGTSLEVPADLKVRQDNSNYGIRYTVMSTPDGDIVIQRSVGDNPYMGEGMSGASDLLNSYDGDKVNGVEIHTCSRTVKNDATGEVIMVSSNRGDNETVEHIVNSIKWGSKTVSSSDAGDSAQVSSASSEPSAYAYKADGTPMYSQDEVDDYMLHKYGMVNYHVGDNGYIDMDEHGYDDAGHRLEDENMSF